MKFFLTLSSLVVALLATALYRWHGALFPRIPCGQDAPIEYEGRKWNACDVFSLEYKDAREKFRTLARKKGASEVVALPIVEQEDLTVDIAIFPGTRPGAILHSSGTHGVEGYAGSAIQLALLESLETISADDRPTLILVHALNPYGMANYRRFNENNVDLNRNAIVDFPKFLASRDPNIAGYEDFREIISQSIAPSAWESSVGLWAKVIPRVAHYGLSHLKRVFVTGQYHHQQGVFYGGTEWERSLVQLNHFMETKNLWEEVLVHIDVHTGLGKNGMDTIMADNIVDENMDLEQIFRFAESIISPDVDDKGAMDGYDLARGEVCHLVYHKNSNCLAVWQEFGTVPPLVVARALMLENALYNHGDKATRAQGRQWMQQAFYPQSSQWRASIVQRGVAAVLDAIEYSKTVPIKKKDPVSDTVEPREET